MSGEKQNPGPRGQFRVFVKNLARGCTKQDVENIFRDSGYNVVGSWFPDNGRFAFIDFDDLQEAEKAVTDMTGKMLLNMPMQVELSKSTSGNPGAPSGSQSGRTGRGPSRPRYRLRVTGMSQNTSWQDLKDVMRGTGGTVTFASVAVPFCGEGHAEFASEEELLQAIEKLDGTVLDGNKVEVRRDLEEPKYEQFARRRRDDRYRQQQPRRGRRSPSPPPRHRHYRDNEDDYRRHHHRSPPPRRRNDSPSRGRARSPPRRRRADSRG